MTDIEGQGREEAHSKRVLVIKLIVLGVVSVGLALLFGYELGMLSSESGIREVLFAGGALLLWLTALVIQFFAVNTFRIAIPLLAFEAGALLVFLPVAGEGGIALLAATGLLVLFLLGGFWRSRTDLNNHLNVRFFRTATHGLGPVLTGIALFLSVYGVGLVNAPRLSIHPNVIQIVLEEAVPIARRLIPGFSPGLPLRQFLESFAGTRLPGSVPNRGAAVGVLADELSKQLERMTRIRIEAADTVNTFVERAVNEGLGRLPEKAKLFVLFGIGILLFLALKGLAFFVNWAVTLLAFLAYQFLLVFGFFYLGFENRSKEVVLIG